MIRFTRAESPGAGLELSKPFHLVLTGIFKRDV